MLPRALAAVGLFALIVGVSGRPVAAQPAPAPAKKVLTFADYDNWNSVSGIVLSRDGSHIAYVVGTEEKDGEAVVRNISTGKEFRFARGSLSKIDSTPRFTPDGKRVLLPITPTKAQLEKAKADKAKGDDVPKGELLLVDVASGKELDRISGVAAFQVGGEGAGFLIYRKTPTPEEKKDGAKTEGQPTPPVIGKFGKGTFPGKGGQFGARGDGQSGAQEKKYGTDLLIRDLTGTQDRVIPEVTNFSLSNDEKTLVYTVSGKAEEKNGVYACNPRFGTAAAPLKSGPGRYTNITWDEKQTRLAFYYDDSVVTPPNVAPPPRPKGAPVGSGTGLPPSPPPPAKWRVFVWDRPGAGEAARLPNVPIRPAGAGLATAVSPVLAVAAPAATSGPVEVLNPGTPGIKKGWSVVDNSLTFSLDGSKLYVSTAPDRPSPRAPTPDDFQLEIWHWKDAAIQPMQKVRADEEKKSGRVRSFNAVVLLDTMQFRHLSEEGVNVGPPLTGDWAVRSDDRKYRHTTGYAAPVPNDHSLLNLRTGESKPLLTNVGFSLSLSPNGKYLLGFDGKDWFTISVPDGKKTNLTYKLKEKFYDEEHDTPNDPPPYGGGQWTPDGKFVLVSDRYDIWKLAADGTGTENLTKIGRASNVRFTILRPRSPEERNIERTTDISKPLLLGAHNLVTKDHGFYRLEPGAAPKKLVMGPRVYGTITKARDADVYLLTAGTFSQYPDYYITDPTFSEMKRVTDINPHVKDYNWGTSELVHYTSTDGDKLSGILVKPENFDPKKKYPMIVYIYERLSDGVHRFSVPNVTRGQVINPTFYASNGYLVLMPDIAYRTGTPGQSALRCILPAIQAVADKGYVDEGAIGINGQSWGGYQIAYLVTQTNRFKAAVAGAPVANMTSAYSGIRWGSGLPRQFQYEKQQSRIGATLWEAPMKYIENSPVFMADRVQTPLLMIHNDADDAVPWYQGIEYFLALRRLGKEAYLLNYNGEPHNLAKKATARDFSVRMFQFFEHHLRGKPAPEWMQKGVPYIEREKEKESIKKVLGGKP
jgi:dipeptidyl aminopeptidase/acylaminoacyl peptidase